MPQGKTKGRSTQSQSRSQSQRAPSNGGRQSKSSGGGSEEMTTLRDLLIHELEDIFHAEKQLVKALPKMAKGASSPQLKQAIESHLEETREQVNRLEQAFRQLGEKAQGKKCEAMEGLVEEGAEMLEEDGEDSVIDAGIIAAAQKVEHYEIASYGCVCAWAKNLGENEVADLLGKTLEEEKAADEKLTEIAESSVNQQSR